MPVGVWFTVAYFVTIPIGISSDSDCSTDRLPGAMVIELACLTVVVPATESGGDFTRADEEVCASHYVVSVYGVNYSAMSAV